ncbi:MAG: sulfate permease [Syntrophomonadaceae bacterium]|jgi:predicted benzoate:H+ symporter BenE|nr:sulfate permease [Syntrophomonadaceae bacterium]
MNAKLSHIKGDIAGSIGDLGTFLPYIIGVITIGGMNATAVLFTFGLMYIFTGYFYRVPIPVQPMKVIGAVVLVNGLTTGEIAASGILMGLALLLLALTGLADKLARLTPFSVTAGIQAGLGISLALLGINFISAEPLLGIAILLFMFFLLGNPRIPAALLALLGGTLLSLMIHPELRGPVLHLGFNWPQLVWPQWQDFYRGFTLGFLPQFPLTLTNSILVTAALAKELYSDKAVKVNEKNLCFTLGIGNLLSMPLGGFLVCHGSGGLAAHHRFGARTGLSVIILGVFLLLTAIILGPSSVELLELVPQAVLGPLLFYSGIDLAVNIKGLESRNNIYTFAVVLIISIAVNPGLGFLVGVPLIYVLNKGLVRL